MSGQQQIQLATQHVGAGEFVDPHGLQNRRWGEHPRVDQCAHLDGKLRGVGRRTVPQDVANLGARFDDVVGRQQRRVQHHGVYAPRMPHPEPGRYIAAVGGAVDDGLLDLRVVEHRGEIVDRSVDTDRFRRQVPTGIVVARQTHAAMFHHDHVEAVDRSTAAKSPVQRDRRRSGPARDDQQWMPGLATGAHVVDVEVRAVGPAARMHRPAHSTHSRQAGQPVVRPPTPGAHRHRSHSAPLGCSPNRQRRVRRSARCARHSR